MSATGCAPLFPRVPAILPAEAVREFGILVKGQFDERRQKLAQGDEVAPWPQPAYELVRILKAHYVEMDASRKAVEAFCHAAGLEIAPIWLEVRRHWEGRLAPAVINDGNDGWQWASAREVDCPIAVAPFSPVFERLWADELATVNRVAGLCWYLHLYNARGAGRDEFADDKAVPPLPLSGPKLAEWLWPDGRHHAAAYEIRNLLVEAGVLVCVDTSYRFNAGAGANRAQKFKLTQAFLSYIQNGELRPLNNEDHEVVTF